MTPDASPSKGSNFRRFFFRGLGVLLPTVLTIWILVAVYQFVESRIAGPINSGVRTVWVTLSPWPTAGEDDFERAAANLTPEEQTDLELYLRRQRLSVSEEMWPEREQELRREWLRPYARQRALRDMWDKVSIGGWPVLDVIGLLIAVVLIYIAGLLLGNYIGHQIYTRTEDLLKRIPIIKHIYPHVKQVTDFLFGEAREQMQFSKVVAVQYPRKGIWSLGLLTGDTMGRIADAAGVDCATVFIPSSPTPFTGYVITVPRTDMIELSISIDEALRFTVSGGVIVPPSQVIDRGDGGEREALPAASGAAPSTESGEDPADPDRA